MSNNCNHDNIETFDKKYLEEQIGITRANLNIFLKAIGMNQSSFTAEEVAKIIELRQLKEREGLTMPQMAERFGGNSQSQNKSQDTKAQQQQPNQPQDDKQALIDANQNIGSVANKIIAGMVFKNVNDTLAHIPQITINAVNTICDKYNGNMRMEEAADLMIEELMELPDSSVGKLQSSNPYDLGMALSDVNQKLLEGAEESQDQNINNQAE